LNKKIIGISFLLLFMAMPVFLQACQDKALDFEVLSLNITPPKITTGDKATVKVEIRNNNAENTTYNVPLMVDGVADDRKSVTLAPGATELITFTLTRNHPGTYSISVGSSESTLVVEKLVPPEFHLFNLEINPTEVDSGEAVVITAKIANVGGTQSSYTAELKVDDCTVQTEKVTLAAGTDATLSFKICADLPGTYKVTLGELAGKFIVAQPVVPIRNNSSNTSPASNPNSCSARG
jgi:uncharacterized protein YfaS (alpha-2-macroglobulin family)